MSTCTLEEYVATLKTHDPQPSDEDLRESVDYFREYLEVAKETGEKQEFIDCRTGEVGVICYPDGRIEWIEKEKENVRNSIAS